MRYLACALALALAAPACARLVWVQIEETGYNLEMARAICQEHAEREAERHRRSSGLRGDSGLPGEESAVHSHALRACMEHHGWVLRPAGAAAVDHAPAP